MQKYIHKTSKQRHTYKLGLSSTQLYHDDLETQQEETLPSCTMLTMLQYTSSSISSGLWWWTWSSLWEHHLPPQAANAPNWLRFTVMPPCLKGCMYYIIQWMQVHSCFVTLCSTLPGGTTLTMNAWFGMYLYEGFQINLNHNWSNFLYKYVIHLYQFKYWFRLNLKARGVHQNISFWEFAKTISLAILEESNTFLHVQ